jgi:hypothetical protein
MNKRNESVTEQLYRYQLHCYNCDERQKGEGKTVSTAVLEDFNQIEPKIRKFIKESINTSDFTPQKTDSSIDTSDFTPQKEDTGCSRLLIAAQVINDLADSINKNWDKFSPEQRRTLKKFAYDLIDYKKNQNFFQRLIAKIKANVLFLKLKIRGEDLAIAKCAEAVEHLIDSVLDAIEREDPLYQQILVDTLEELKSYPKNQVGSEDTRGVRSISSSADAEL